MVKLLTLIRTYISDNTSYQQEFSKAIIDRIVQNYLRPLFIDGAVPENFDLVPEYARNQFVNYFNNELFLIQHNFPEVPLPFNKATFAANPGRLLPIFRVIAETYEEYHREHQNDDPQTPLPTRFSLHPNPTYRWKFMAMDTHNSQKLLFSSSSSKQRSI